MVPGLDSALDRVRTAELCRSAALRQDPDSAPGLPGVQTASPQRRCPGLDGCQNVDDTSGGFSGAGSDGRSRRKGSWLFTAPLVSAALDAGVSGRHAAAPRHGVIPKAQSPAPPSRWARGAAQVLPGGLTHPVSHEEVSPDWAQERVAERGGNPQRTGESAGC